jgi:flagellar hook-associated protein 2
MAGILGVGSGIDIDSIVTALVNAEKAPKTQQLDRLEKATTSRFSALGTLKGSLSNLQTAIQNLNKPSLFTSRTASSSASGVLTAKADSSAVAGKYSVQVQQLATSSKVDRQCLDRNLQQRHADHFHRLVQLRSGCHRRQQRPQRRP